jgi:hypothetical protein
MKRYFVEKGRGLFSEDCELKEITEEEYLMIKMQGYPPAKYSDTDVERITIFDSDNNTIYRYDNDGIESWTKYPKNLIGDHFAQELLSYTDEEGK